MRRMVEDRDGFAGGKQSEPRTILVVEADVLMRVLVCAELRRAGFSVIEARSSDEAVEVLEYLIPIDLVFANAAIPGALNGFALAKWVRRRQPMMPVVLT